jgi:hypothetical protein
MANANTKPYEIIAGPLDIYLAPVGTTFPWVDMTDAALQAGGTWSYLGYTEGGIKVAHPQTVVELRADQVTGPVKAVRSEEGLEITFDLASLTLENYAAALNRFGSGVSVAGGNTSVPLYRGGFQVEQVALLARQGHLSPYGDEALQFEVPSCFQADAPEDTFTKDNKAVLATSWHVIIDPDASTADDSFGHLRAGGVAS